MLSTLFFSRLLRRKTEKEHRMEQLQQLLGVVTDHEEFLDALLIDAAAVMSHEEAMLGLCRPSSADIHDDGNALEQFEAFCGLDEAGGGSGTEFEDFSPPRASSVQSSSPNRPVTSEHHPAPLIEIYATAANDEYPSAGHPDLQIAVPPLSPLLLNDTISSFGSTSDVKKSSVTTQQHHRHHSHSQLRRTASANRNRPSQQHHDRPNHFIGAADGMFAKSGMFGRSIMSDVASMMNASVRGGGGGNRKKPPVWLRGSSKAAKLLTQQRAENEAQSAAMHLHSIDNDGPLAALVDALFVVSSVFSCMVAITLQHPTAKFDQLDIPPTPVIVWFVFQGLLSFAWMALRFFTRIRREWDVVDELPTIREEYMTTWFKFDLFICVPFEILFIGWVKPTIFYILTLRHFLRYIRIYSLGASTNPLLPSRAWLQFLTFVCTMFLVVHCVANIFWSIENQYQPSPLTYTKSIYWAAITMTSVGFGDITPKTDFGKGFSIVAMMLGVLLVSTFISGATYFLTATNGFEQALEDRRKMLWAMLEHFHIPDELELEVLKNFHVVQSNFAEHVFNEHLALLPDFMEEKLRSHFNAGLLGTMPMFKNVSADALIQLSSRMSKHTVGPSDVIFEAGADTSELVFVVSGVVQLVRVTETGEVVVVDEIQQGGVIGPLTGDRAGLVARATAKVDFVKVQSKDLVDVVQDVPELASTFVRTSISLDQLTKDIQNEEAAEAILVSMDWQQPLSQSDGMDGLMDAGRAKPEPPALGRRKPAAVEGLDDGVVNVIPQIVESIVVPSFTFANVRASLAHETPPPPSPPAVEEAASSAPSAADVEPHHPPLPQSRSPRTAALEGLFFDWFVLLEDWFDGEDVMYVLRAIEDNDNDDEKGTKRIDGFLPCEHPVVSVDISSFGAPRSSSTFLEYLTNLTRTFSDDDVVAFCAACSKVIFPLVSTQVGLCVKKATVQAYRELVQSIGADQLATSVQRALRSVVGMNVTALSAVLSPFLEQNRQPLKLPDFVMMVHQLCGPSYERTLGLVQYLMCANGIDLSSASSGGGSVTLLHERSMWHSSQDDLDAALAHAFDGVQHGAFLTFATSTSDEMLQRLKYCVVSLFSPLELSGLTLEEGEEVASTVLMKLVASGEGSFNQLLVRLATFRNSTMDHRQMVAVSSLLLSSHLNPSVVLPRSRVAHALARWALLAVQRVCHVRNWAFPPILLSQEMSREILERGARAAEVVQQSLVEAAPAPRELSSTPEPPDF